MKRSTIVIVGTGAYVTEDALGPGVVARSVAQWGEAQGPEAAPRVVGVFRSEAGRRRLESTWAGIRAEQGGAPALECVAAGSEAMHAEIARASALLVCVPDAAHAEYVSLGIERGVPTWVVKPLTGELEGAEALVDAATRRGAAVWVDYHKRFDPSNRALRSAIESGAHGRPLLYSVRYSQPRSLPLEQFAWAGETDVFTYIGCHYVDQLFYLMPTLEIESVSARGLPGPVHARLGGAAWDTVLARLDGRLDGHPMTAQFEVGWSNPTGSPTKSLQHVELGFERGRVFADQADRGVQIWDDRGVAVPNPYFFSRIHDPIAGRPRYQGYGYDSIRHFLDFAHAPARIQGAWLANASLPWARASLRVERVLAAVRRALATGAQSVAPSARPLAPHVPSPGPPA